MNLRSACAIALVVCGTLAGCNGGSSSSSVQPVPPVETSSSTTTATPTPLPSPVDNNVWQNPFMSTNPTNNIHNDSYLSDSYAYAGPVTAVNPVTTQVNAATFKDPYTGQQRVAVFGEGASQAFDAAGDIQTYCGGIPDPITNTTTRSIVTFDHRTLEVKAYLPFTIATGDNGLTDFGGAGYFYQDQLNRVVAGLPGGNRIGVLQRAPSAVSDVDQYLTVRDVDVIDQIPVPSCDDKLSLYAVVPDKVGNIWFTTGQGVVGTVTPDGAVKWLDLNDPNRTGACVPQADGGFQTIANSHAVDEGDSDSGPSGVYVLTTYNLYRLEAGPDGTPQIAWQIPYDRGTFQKPGQVSFGSGSSPTVFRMGGRRFVTIVDNAASMHCNVYRAEDQLQPGEQRLFAQAVCFPGIAAGTFGAPAGAQPVSDENSEIVAPAQDGSGGVDIYAENNWGYTAPSSVQGDLVLQPGGFVRMRLTPDGTLTAASINPTISVPTIVSKVSVASKTVYTYEKRTDGWYLTGLDSTDLNTVRFSVRTGDGQLRYNNHYSALSLDPDGRTIYLGTLFGVTRVSVNNGP
jgi:hypothetical protein